ncbi:MAG: hypothetical protein KTR31_16305 [Myxococcales bacterium]|nr:hypothetical protein [Myxococcales bacterium]
MANHATTAWSHSPAARTTFQRPVGGARGHRLDLRRASGVTVVSLQGELSERFDGVELGRRLRGDVIFDLYGIERITSFGVRGWLTMLKELYATRVFLARCSEPFINQVSMIRSFCGPGRIVSFLAPYACSSCGTEFSALYDAVQDAALIDQRHPAAVACPNCDTAADFNDDPEVFLSLEHHVVRDLEPEVALALAQLDSLEGSPIRKAVVGDETWVTFNARIDGSLRLSRALDGLEGVVVFDLSASPHATLDGLDRLLEALTQLGPEVQQIQLVGCPFEMLELLIRVEHAHPGGADPRLCINSVRVRAQSRTDPQVRRLVLVDLRLDHVRSALSAGQSPHIPCDWSDGPLDFGHTLPTLARALRWLAPSVLQPAAPSRAWQRVSDAGEPPAWHSHDSLPSAPSIVTDSDIRRVTSVSHGLSPALPNPSNTLVPFEMTAMQPPAGPRSRTGALWLAGIAMGMGVLVGSAGLLGGVLIVASERNGDLQTGLSSPATGWEGGVAPEWAHRSFSLSMDEVELVGNGPGRTPEEGLDVAQRDMMRTLLTHLGPTVSQRAGMDLVLRPAERLTDSELEVAIRAYTQQVGDFATPVRTDGAIQHVAAGLRVVARYELPTEAWSQAADFYSDTLEFRGMTVAPLFPTSVPAADARGQVAVVDTRAWMRAAAPGDVVIGVGDEAVTDLAQFRRILQAAWDRTSPGTELVIHVVRNGFTHQVPFRKPSAIH